MYVRINGAPPPRMYVLKSFPVALHNLRTRYRSSIRRSAAIVTVSRHATPQQRRSHPDSSQENMQRLSPRTGSGVPQLAASAEGRIVGEEDWQRCRMILEARKAEEQSPPMQEHIADLSVMLQKLNKRERPNQSELRQMAKSLGLPQQRGF